MNDEATTEQSGRRPRRSRAVIAGVGTAGLVAGLALGSFGVASAQTDSPTTAPAQAVPNGEIDGPAEIGRMHIHGGPGMKFGMGGGIHGENTVPANNGGYQTLANQVGKVTSVSKTSITIKSDDNYSKTYDVNDDTIVRSADEGISDIKEGDQVMITATVKDGKYSAVSIDDSTQVTTREDKWAPKMNRSFKSSEDSQAPKA